MKYAVHYSKDFKFLKEIDEVILDWEGTDQILDFVPKTFLQEQRIIINLKQIENIEDVIPCLNKLKALHSNIAVQIGLDRADAANLLKMEDIDFMFYDYCTTIEMYYLMKELGASDIYITEILGFGLEDLQEEGERSVKLRVFPNIAQCDPHGKGILPEITKFWIRPEDTELYEELVDVFEFYGTKDGGGLSTIYKIYKKCQWLGDLKDIILDFHLDISNKTIAPHFGKMRLNCHKKCLYGKCNVCPNIASLAEGFNTAEIEVVKRKRKEQYSQEEKEQIINTLKERGKKLIEDESTINEETMHPSTE